MRGWDARGGGCGVRGHAGTAGRLGQRIGKRVDDIQDDVLVTVDAEGEFGFGFDAIESLQEQLGRIGESGGFTGVDAILGEQIEDPAQRLIHVGIGPEGAVASEKLIATPVRVAHFPLEFGVDITEERVRVDAGHAATAIQDVVVLTAR